MGAKVVISGTTASLVLDGLFDFSTHRDFRQACDEILACELVQDVLVDFRNVEYLDSSALGMLLLLKEKAGSGGRTLALVNCQEPVRQVLDIACFGKIFTIR